MNFLVCIDDTDNLNSRGTGHIAEDLRFDLEKRFNAKTSRISRHQLYVHERIPYTSHNSTMCFTAEFDKKYYKEMIEFSANFLVKESAEGSDPGLCVVMPQNLKDKSLLIDFGFRATNSVLTKKEAYSLADDLKIHLSEHGGTGDGIIGALAGTGLRLSGNHGRFRGWIEIDDNDRLISAGELCKKYDIEEVREIDSDKLLNTEMISLEGKIKTILLDGKAVLPVKKAKENKPSQWKNLSREEIKAISN